MLQVVNKSSVKGLKGSYLEKELFRKITFDFYLESVASQREEIYHLPPELSISKNSLFARWSFNCFHTASIGFNSGMYGGSCTK